MRISYQSFPPVKVHAANQIPPMSEKKLLAIEIITHLFASKSGCRKAIARMAPAQNASREHDSLPLASSGDILAVRASLAAGPQSKVVI